jgi:hypothetical protein
MARFGWSLDEDVTSCLISLVGIAHAKLVMIHLRNLIKVLMTTPADARYFQKVDSRVNYVLEKSCVYRCNKPRYALKTCASVVQVPF